MIVLSATPISIEPNGRDGDRIVVVTCPYCGKHHKHGLPNGHRLPTHRIAHCSDGLNAGYTILRTDTME